MKLPSSSLACPLSLSPHSPLFSPSSHLTSSPLPSPPEFVVGCWLYTTKTYILTIISDSLFFTNGDEAPLVAQQYARATQLRHDHVQPLLIHQPSQVVRRLEGVFDGEEHVVARELRVPALLRENV
jgi:hypothetical protein